MNTLTPGIYTFKCEVTEGSSEGRGETTLTVRPPPKLIVTAEKNVTVTKLPYDLTCSISNLRWNKVETMTLTWKENGKDLFFFDGSKSNSQSERYRCDKANPSHCLLRLNEKKSNGDYTCIVTEGKAEGSATIKVKFEVPIPLTTLASLLPLDLLLLLLLLLLLVVCFTKYVSKLFIIKRSVL
ncbi:leukocyte surface antigen CD47-like [Polypterus senegalus]|uniref:leukocyte surface antigen CD47-like n=1 Tax=Polypterus senegalus TaxID=55291 RepID=UPI001963515E|nr:leukocyte surface antigen CD47-like [Polypterus senegalus]